MSFCPCIYTKDKNKKKNKKWVEGFIRVEEGKVILYNEEKRKLFSFKGIVCEEMECLYYLIFMENAEDVIRLNNGCDSQRNCGNSDTEKEEDGNYGRNLNGRKNGGTKGFDKEDGNDSNDTPVQNLYLGDTGSSCGCDSGMTGHDSAADEKAYNCSVNHRDRGYVSTKNVSGQRFADTEQCCGDLQSDAKRLKRSVGKKGRTNEEIWRMIE